MSVTLGMIAQPLFTDNVTPYEVKTRLEAVYAGKPCIMVRMTLYPEVKPTLERAKELEAALGEVIGRLIYAEIVPDYTDLSVVNEGNFLYQTPAGDLTYFSFTMHSSSWLTIFRPTLDEAMALTQRVADLLPRQRVVLKERKVVEMSFWLNSGGGPSAINRIIDIAPYKSVTPNYTQLVSDQLAWTMKYEPGESGKLFLWHGEPGTGKTHAIRALCWEWRRWARCNYITDPEQFFGSPLYMFQVMSATTGNRISFSGDDDDTVSRARGEKWNLIILEDCGELIRADAKEATGQGLSRLLNMVDGLLGQGMRILVLMTTNEPVQELHPAVMRAGRCAQELKFLPLEKAEANGWLKAQELEAEVDRDTVIADLFAIKQASAPKRQVKRKKGMGFQ